MKGTITTSILTLTLLGVVVFAFFLWQDNQHLGVRVTSMEQLVQAQQTDTHFLEQSVLDIVKVLADTKSASKDSKEELLLKMQSIEEVGISNKNNIGQNNVALGDNLVSLQKTIGLIKDNESRVQRITDKWKKVLVKIKCEDDENRTSGSGVFFKDGFAKSVGATILTNKHVIEEDDEVIDTCSLFFTNADISEDVVFSEKQLKSYGELDAVSFNTTIYSTQLSLGEKYSQCKDDLKVGEGVLIFGYPKIGLENSITLTEGVISGYEDDYYVTSAKIAKGNSGGAAISISQDCYIGIPTLVMKGQVESLGRILDARKIF